LEKSQGIFGVVVEVTVSLQTQQDSANACWIIVECKRASHYLGETGDAVNGSTIMVSDVWYTNRMPLFHVQVMPIPFYNPKGNMEKILLLLLRAEVRIQPVARNVG